MTSRWDEAPTPQELAVWRQVASVPSASGTFRWEPRGAGGFGWAFSGRAPALVDVPAGADVAFWHVAPDRWRLEAGGELLAVSDGKRAAARVPGGVRVGPTLLMPCGPAVLLRPGHGGVGLSAHGDRADEVVREDLLGRRAWRWTSGQSVWWLDEETGCGLRQDGPGGALAFVELQTGVEIDRARFTVPRIAAADVVEWCDIEPPAEQTPVPTGPPRFTVPWWPTGTLAYPEQGDPAVPEVLLVLATVEQTPAFFLGIAPAGVRARTRRGCAVRRWRSRDWEFALSWRGEVSPDDVDRVVASIPEQW